MKKILTKGAAAAAAAEAAAAAAAEEEKGVQVCTLWRGLRASYGYR